MTKKQIRISESDLKQMVKESVNKVLTENYYFQHDSADEMINQIYDLLEREDGYKFEELKQVGICQALWLFIQEGNEERRYLANQYIEEIGGVENVVKCDLEEYKERHIKPYIGALKKLYNYPPEPRGWYQSEPYFGGYPGKD